MRSQNKIKAAQMKQQFEAELADAKAQLAAKKALVIAQAKASFDDDDEQIEDIQKKKKGRWVYVYEEQPKPKKVPAALEEP